MLFPGRRHYLDTYAHHGLVGPRTVLAHNVHPTDHELDVLAGARAWVAHCPTSNAALGSGLFPLRRHLDRGVGVALGSDVGAGTGFSLVKEGLQAYFVQQLLGPTGLPLSPVHLLHLATRAGADCAGSRRPGRRPGRGQGLRRRLAAADARQHARGEPGPRQGRRATSSRASSPSAPPATSRASGPAAVGSRSRTRNRQSKDPFTRPPEKDGRICTMLLLLRPCSRAARRDASGRERASARLQRLEHRRRRAGGHIARCGPAPSNSRAWGRSRTCGAPFRAGC